jgi:hypothetical protein
VSSVEATNRSAFRTINVLSLGIFFLGICHPDVLNMVVGFLLASICVAKTLSAKLDYSSLLLTGCGRWEDDSEHAA